MRRRPVCLLCLIFISVLSLLFFLGVPFSSKPPGSGEIEALLQKPCVSHLSGRVRSCRTQENVTYLILEASTLNEIRFSKDRADASVPALPSPDILPFPLGGVRIVLGEARHIAVGSEVTAAGVLSPVEGPTNPGQFDQKLYWEIQKVSWNLKKPLLRSLKEPSGGAASRALSSLQEALSRLGQHFTDRIEAIFPEEAAGAIAAMITGDKSLLSEDSKNLYRLGGISHMLAISGLHITLLGMGLFRILRKLRLPLWAAGPCAAAFLAAYAVLTGGSVATLRAVFMFLLYLLSQLTHRVYDVPTALAAAAILLLLENPLYLLYAGFQLSFVAVLALTAFPGRGRFFSGLILYLITAPLTLYHYFALPVYGVLINLLVVPLLPFVLGSGILALAGSYVLELFGLLTIGSLPLAILTAPAALLLKLIDHLLSLAALLPFASLPLGRPSVWQLALYALLLAIFLVFIVKWHRSYRKYALLLAVPLLLGVFFLRPANRLTLTFLDVGQGDGIVLSLPGHTLLVDGGSSTVSEVGKNRIQPYLAFSGVRRLEYIAATHMDTDHISGIREILTAVGDKTAGFTVGTLLLPKTGTVSDSMKELAALARSANVRVLRVAAGDSISLGEASLEVLGPDPAAETLPIDENAQCIVLGLHYKDFDCLLTGDVQGKGEESLLARLRKIAAARNPGADKEKSPPGAEDQTGGNEAGKNQAPGGGAENGNEPGADGTAKENNAPGAYGTAENGYAEGAEAPLFSPERLDVLKVAHHGSKNSTPASLLALTSPKVSILSCGRNNSYGHPHSELLSRLEAAGTRIYRTDLQGAVTVEVLPGSGGFTISTFLKES